MVGSQLYAKPGDINYQALHQSKGYAKIDTEFWKVSNKESKAGK